MLAMVAGDLEATTLPPRTRRRVGGGASAAKMGERGRLKVRIIMTSGEKRMSIQTGSRAKGFVLRNSTPGGEPGGPRRVDFWF